MKTKLLPTYKFLNLHIVKKKRAYVQYEHLSMNVLSFFLGDHLSIFILPQKSLTVLLMLSDDIILLIVNLSTYYDVILIACEIYLK